MKIVKKWQVLVGILGGVVFNDRVMANKPNITVEEIDDHELPNYFTGSDGLQDLPGFLRVPAVSGFRMRGYKKGVMPAGSGNFVKSIAKVRAEQLLNERLTYIRNALMVHVPAEYVSDLSMILKGTPNSPLFNQEAFDHSMFKFNNTIAHKIKEIQEKAISVVNGVITQPEFEEEFWKEVWFGDRGQSRLVDSLLDEVMEVVRKERKQLAAR